MQVAAAIDLAGGGGGVGSGSGGGERALAVVEGYGRGATGEEEAGAGGRLLRGFGEGGGDVVGGEGVVVVGRAKVVEGLLAVGRYEEAADVVLRGLDDKVRCFLGGGSTRLSFVG